MLSLEFLACNRTTRSQRARRTKGSQTLKLTFQLAEIFGAPFVVFHVGQSFPLSILERPVHGIEGVALLGISTLGVILYFGSAFIALLPSAVAARRRTNRLRLAHSCRDLVVTERDSALAIRALMLFRPEGALLVHVDLKNIHVCSLFYHRPLSHAFELGF